MHNSFICNSAATRILTELADAREDRCDDSWMALCLDTLVHVANAEGGMIVNAHGESIDVGVPAGSVDRVRQASQSTDSSDVDDIGLVVTCDLVEMADSEATLVLYCGHYDAVDVLDLDALCVTMSPLLWMAACNPFSAKENVA